MGKKNNIVEHCCSRSLLVEVTNNLKNNMYEELSSNEDELKNLYRIYLQVQSGDQAALNGLFKATESRQICKIDEINKEYRLSHMDNVLDTESVLDSERDNKDKEWIDSVHSKVIFQFPCLNKMLYKKKKFYLSKAKNTGYENGKRNTGHSKFYEGEYDISDFNEIMYETIIEIFISKTDKDNCLTLDGKKNEKYPICDGISLLKNISYFTSRKVNKRAKNSYLDIYDTEFWDEETGTVFLGFDEYVLRKFIESEKPTSRLTIYEEYLAWLKRNDVHKLFKANAWDIHTIIDTIMDNEDVFMKDMSGDNEIGFGMRLVTQEKLQKIIRSRYNINVEQENISKDMEHIEQRLLEHLLYALNYRIDKAEKSRGIYKKESKRFLYELDEIKYIKVFSKTSYKMYDESIKYIHGEINSNNMKSYVRVIKKYEDMFIDIVSLEKGKRKYDMINLILENNDLVDNENETLLDIANTVVSFYQKEEEEYRKNTLKDYKIKKFNNWKNGYWEAELRDESLNINLWSNKNVKKPVRHDINKENLVVYCGYMSFYFCNVRNKVGYSLPKDRRIISKANKNHEIFMYAVG